MPDPVVEAEHDDVIGRAFDRRLASRLWASARAHHRLVWIHPFLDGNGRTARALFATVCRKRAGVADSIIAAWLDDLWRFEAASLHGCSSAIRQCGDYGPLISLANRLLTAKTAL